MTELQKQDSPADRQAALGMSALIAAGHYFHSRGWVPATSSNFSVRIDDQYMLVTVSGRHKGHLKPSDFMRMDFRTDESAEPDKKPSAEAALHSLIYRMFDGVGCVLHTHSVNATVFSLRAGARGVRFAGYELLKAFPQIRTHETDVELPVFGNDQDIPRLAAQVEAHLARHADTIGYLIAGHGLYTWGADIAAAVRHVEALEFLLECEYKRLTLSHIPA